MSNLILNRKNVQKAKNYFNSPKGSRKIPYGLGSLLITWFCKTSFARKEYFRGKENLFTQFLESLPEEYDAKKLISKGIYCNFLKGWRSASLSWQSKRVFNKYVSVNGQENLDKALEKGKGVIILNSHFGLAQLGLIIFQVLGYEDFHTIIREKGMESTKFEGLNEKLFPKVLAFKDNTQAELFKQIYKAKEILNRGGMVHLLGDGYHGMSSITIPFLGKLRGFRPSYAELSIASGASVIPIFIDNSINGKITVDILPPLSQGIESMSSDEKKNLMVKEYASLLEEQWLEKPWNVNWRFIEKHLYQVDVE